MQNIMFLKVGLNIFFLQPGKKVITSISYSKYSGLIASGSTDKYVRLWDPKSTGKTASNSSLVAFNFHNDEGRVDFVEQKHRVSENTKKFTFTKNDYTPLSALNQIKTDRDRKTLRSAALELRNLFLRMSNRIVIKRTASSILQNLPLLCHSIFTVTTNFHC